MRVTFAILFLAPATMLVPPALAETPVPWKAVITQQQAVEIVKDFAAKAGITLSGEPRAKFETLGVGRPPFWDVFTGNAYLSVDAYSGRVITVYRLGAETPSSTTGPPNFDAEAATAIATPFAALLGVPQDARLAGVERDNPAGDRPNYFGSWIVKWKRCLGDIPYEDDWMHVGVDGYSGAVIGAGKQWYTLPPKPTEFRLTPDQAVQVASDMLAGKGEPPNSVSPVEVKIVRPNGFWTGKEVETTLFKPSRIAYVLTLWSAKTYQYSGPTGQPTTSAFYLPNIVWLDVENGSILGGTSARGAGPLGEEAKPYSPGQPVPTAFKELPKLPPPSEWPKGPTIPARFPGVVLLALASLIAIAGAGYWGSTRRRRRPRRPGLD